MDSDSICNQMHAFDFRGMDWCQSLLPPAHLGYSNGHMATCHNDQMLITGGLHLFHFLLNMSVDHVQPWHFLSIASCVPFLMHDSWCMVYDAWHASFGQMQSRAPSLARTCFTVVLASCGFAS